MYDDELDNLDNTLRNYTKEERNIYQEEKFEGLLSRYPLKEDATVYRGINFSTRLQYHRFMKKFNKLEGYLTSNAAGFSRDYDTALDFAETTKTYYPTLETLQAEDKRNKEAELMTGYCGIIIKSEVKAGEVIDVNASTFSVEDEVLFRPNTVIKSEI